MLVERQDKRALSGDDLVELMGLVLGNAALPGTSAELELVAAQWEAVRACPDRLVLFVCACLCCLCCLCPDRLVLLVCACLWPGTRSLWQPRVWRMHRAPSQGFYLHGVDLFHLLSLLLYPNSKTLQVESQLVSGRLCRAWSRHAGPLCIR